MQKSNKSLVETKIRKIVKEVLSEDGEKLNGYYDIQPLNDIIQALSKVPYSKHRTNNSTIHKFNDEISKIRMDAMKYLEDNSDYEYQGKGNGWKLVKKKGV